MMGRTDLLWALWGSGVLPMGLALLVARMLPHGHRRRLCGRK